MHVQYYQITYTRCARLKRSGEGLRVGGGGKCKPCSCIPCLCGFSLALLHFQTSLGPNANITHQSLEIQGKYWNLLSEVCQIQEPSPASRHLVYGKVDSDTGPFFKIFQNDIFKAKRELKTFACSTRLISQASTLSSYFFGGRGT